MKVFVLVSMSGVAGVVDETQARAGGFDYERFRRLMTKEASAAVRGAVAAGATEVFVSDVDASSGGKSIMIEDLPEAAWLISGTERPLGQMEGIDSSFDAAIMIGCHARQGTGGVLNHTFDRDTVSDIFLNGQAIGEIGLNAALAGTFEVPIVLVAGDNVAAEEASRLMPRTTTLAVKQALGRQSAQTLHPEKACQQIEKGVAAALKRREEIPPLEIPGPWELRIRFTHTGHLDSVAPLPFVQKVSCNEVVLSTDEPLEGYKLLTVLLRKMSQEGRVV